MIDKNNTERCDVCEVHQDIVQAVRTQLPDEEQLYIGSVILNRRSHGAYPNTIQGVVFQRGQYACTRDGNYYREPTEANWRNAKWLLENGSILPSNVVYQAGFRQGSGIYMQTRYHKYCYR